MENGKHRTQLLIDILQGTSSSYIIFYYLNINIGLAKNLFVDHQIIECAYI